jgi:hypothetical protein
VPDFSSVNSGDRLGLGQVHRDADPDRAASLDRYVERGDVFGKDVDAKLTIFVIE